MEKARKKEVISVPVESVRKLMALHACSRASVFNALGYRSNSKKAERIRHDAIELFGGVVNKLSVFTRNFTKQEEN